MPDTYAARAEEFNRLLVTQASATRSMKTGWRPNDAERAAMDERAARLNELAELMAPRIGVDNPAAYVNERIASWLRANPLALTDRLLAEKLAEDNNQQVVSVVIGDPLDGGYMYALTFEDLQRTHYGQWQLRVPESVAEHFRQAGRRKVQREVASSLALKSHL